MVLPLLFRLGTAVCGAVLPLPVTTVVAAEEAVEDEVQDVKAEK